MKTEFRNLESEYLIADLLTERLGAADVAFGEYTYLESSDGRIVSEAFAATVTDAEGDEVPGVVQVLETERYFRTTWHANAELVVLVEDGPHS